MALFNTKPILGLTYSDDVKQTDRYMAIDTTDNSASPDGTAKQYPVSALTEAVNEMLQGSFKQTAKVVSVTNLTATYFNGPDDNGVGATLTNSGVFASLSIDGYLVQIGDRILVSNQSNPEENGIYIVINPGDTLIAWELERAVDYDGHIEDQISQGDIIGIVLGATYFRTIWFQTAADNPVIGTDPIIFQQQNAIANPAELWTVITTTPQSLVPNNAYIVDTAALAQLTLPVTSNVGDIIKIQGKGAGLFRIMQNAGQQIHSGIFSTTVGAGGYMELTDSKGSLDLLCTVANTEWTVHSGPFGNFDVI